MIYILPRIPKQINTSLLILKMLSQLKLPTLSDSDNRYNAH